MREGIAVAACLMFTVPNPGRSEMAQARPANNVVSGKRCCCCEAGKCNCGCQPTTPPDGDEPAEQGGNGPRYCSCGENLPAQLPKSPPQPSPHRVTNLLEPIADAGDFSRHHPPPAFITGHDPPANLTCLATVILLV